MDNVQAPLNWNSFTALTGEWGDDDWYAKGGSGREYRVVKAVRGIKVTYLVQYKKKGEVRPRNIAMRDTVEEAKFRCQQKENLLIANSIKQQSEPDYKAMYQRKCVAVNDLMCDAHNIKEQRDATLSANNAIATDLDNTRRYAQELVNENKSLKSELSHLRREIRIAAEAIIEVVL